MSNDRWIWDATATLEALGAASVALWLWEPHRDRISFRREACCRLHRQSFAVTGSSCFIDHTCPRRCFCSGDAIRCVLVDACLRPEHLYQVIGVEYLGCCSRTEVCEREAVVFRHESGINVVTSNINR